MRLKYFIFSLLLSLPFWWGVNVLSGKTESFFLQNFILQDSQIFKADVNSALQNAVKKNDLGEPQISAKAAISVLIAKDGSRAFLYRKNIKEQLPVASLTKLMSADIVFENFDVSQAVKIKKSILQDGAERDLLKGQTYNLKDLVFASLVESNNSAAEAISEIIGEDNFVALMNLEAKYLEMKNTIYFNPTGLDPKDNPSVAENPGGINKSTASDLLKLSEHILKNPEIMRALATEQFDLYDSEGKFNHKAITTNELLKSGISFNDMEIAGAKTGQTDKAGGCLILILKNPKNGSYLINIVLGSGDRFSDIKKMAKWAEFVYNL